jgi:hypothetical protein
MSVKFLSLHRQVKIHVSVFSTGYKDEKDNSHGVWIIFNRDIPQKLEINKRYMWMKFTSICITLFGRCKFKCVITVIVIHTYSVSYTLFKLLYSYLSSLKWLTQTSSRCLFGSKKIQILESNSLCHNKYQLHFTKTYQNITLTDKKQF